MEKEKAEREKNKMNGTDWLKKLLFSSVVALAVLFIVGCAASAAPTSTSTPTPTGTPTPEPMPILTPALIPSTGTVEVRATDAPPTGVSKIMVTISKIEIHRADLPEDTWNTIVDEAKTFDLVAIQDAEIFLGQASVSSGNYTQIRMNVTEVIVTLGGKEIIAKLPSDKLRIVRRWEVKPGEKTILALDFDADKFVVITGKTGAQVKPVLKLEVSQGERPLKTPKTTPTPTLPPTR